jgi:hypothetical protein
MVRHLQTKRVSAKLIRKRAMNEPLSFRWVAK